MKDKILNRIANADYGVFFNQISDMKVRALILQKALKESIIVASELSKAVNQLQTLNTRTARANAHMNYFLNKNPK